MSWLRSWCAASRAALHSGAMGPEDVARAAAALVRLRVAPGEGWLNAALAATEGRMMEGCGDAVGHLVRLMTALVRLGATPSQGWLRGLGDAVASVARRQVERQQQEDAQWEGQQEGAGDQQGHWQTGGRVLGSLQPVHVGRLALAWHQLGWQPPAEVAEVLLQASQPWLARYSSARLQLCLSLLAAAGWSPSSKWTSAARARVEALVARGAYSEEQLDKIVWSLSVLDGGSTQA